MKELLFSVTKKDFDIQTFCSGGPGGQHQNKTASGVRIIHRDSGAVGESREYRSQHANKKEALNRLVKSAKFKVWQSKKINEILSGKTLEQKIDMMMTDDKIFVEGKNEQGCWKKIESQNLDKVKISD